MDIANCRSRSEASMRQDIEAGPQSSQDPVGTSTTERREWVRVTIPDVDASLGWEDDEGKSSCYFVTLLDLSRFGAALLMDGEAPARRPLCLKLCSSTFQIPPIEAALIAQSPHESGKTLARLKFNSPLPSIGQTELPRERRSTMRFPARER